jgi:hypothetical protein
MGSTSACWKAILKREPNTEHANLRRHKRVTFTLGVIFTVVLSISIAFGVQNGHDRQTTARVEQSMTDFSAIANKIGKIKGRDMETTRDYIEAYSEMEPLIVDFDSRLHTFNSVLLETKEKDKSRGPLNIQLLYGKKEKDWMAWDEQVFSLLLRDSELTKQQVLVAKQMAALPEKNQPEFWERNFRPLLEEENALRQKLAAVQGSKPN